EEVTPKAEEAEPPKEQTENVLELDAKTPADDKSESEPEAAQAELTEDAKPEEANPDETSESTGDDDLDEMNDYASQVAAKKAKKVEEDEDTKRAKVVQKLVD